MKTGKNVFVRQRTETAEEPRAKKKTLAVIHAVAADGKLQIRIDGETQPRQRPCWRLASYSSPTVGDRVHISEAGDTFIVLGKIL